MAQIIIIRNCPVKKTNDLGAISQCRLVLVRKAPLQPRIPPGKLEEFWLLKQAEPQAGTASDGFLWQRPWIQSWSKIFW